MAESQPPKYGEYEVNFPRQPLLTADEERELAERRDAGDESAVDELVRRNLPMLAYSAKAYIRRTRILSFGDFVHEGYFGLLRAAQQYDPARGRFSTCATQYIRAAMLAAIPDHEYTIRSPRYVANLMDQTRRRLDDPHAQGSREAVEMLGLRPKQVDYVLSGLVTRNIASISGMEGEIPDHRGSGDGEEVERQRTRLRESLSVLNPRERAVIEGRRLRSKALTLREIGATLGLTKERVRQIEAEAIEKLRRWHAA